MRHFKDRTDAGKHLAAAISIKEYTDPVVLALPRGGVPVGIEVARRLQAPLDLLMVRKIGAPDQPELAVGAVANGDHPEIEVNSDVAQTFGLALADVQHMAEVQLDEIRRRRARYSDGLHPVPVNGRTAIVVDDGIATGATVKVAIKALRRRSPAAVILAVPVAPAEVLDGMRAHVDELLCLASPMPFWAVGAHFSDFRQTTDEEVIQLLKEAALICDPTKRKPPA